MDDSLERYLDGTTLLLGIIAGELFALGLPARVGASRSLWGLGFGAVTWAVIAGYQRGAIGGT